MRKLDIFNIFKAGLEYGATYGPFPGLKEKLPQGKESLFNLHRGLTERYNDPVLWTVIVAGFNVGANLRKRVLTHEEMTSMFENLIQGKPLEEGDNSYYTIKEKIDNLLAEKPN